MTTGQARSASQPRKPAPAPGVPGQASAYLRNKVLTASPEELRLLLLDGAIRFAIQGREGLTTRDYEATYNGLSQCRAIILELLTTIRSEPDPALAERVRGLYTFLFNEIVEAGFTKDAARIDEVIRILQYERETWVMLMAQLARERAGEPPSESGASGTRALSVEA